jgi:hypothetical protein
MGGPPAASAAIAAAAAIAAIAAGPGAAGHTPSRQARTSWRMKAM